MASADLKKKLSDNAAEAAQAGFRGLTFYYHNRTRHVIVQWAGSEVKTESRSLAEALLYPILKAEDNNGMGHGTEILPELDMLTDLGFSLEPVAAGGSLFQVDGDPVDPADFNMAAPAPQSSIDAAPVPLSDTAVDPAPVPQNAEMRITAPADGEQGKDLQVKLKRVDEEEETSDVAPPDPISLPSAKVKGDPVSTRKKENVYKCENCDKTFRNKSTLTKHRVAHRKSYRHQCPVCDEPLPSASDLKRHRRSHSCGKLKELHHCPFCSESFTSAGKFKTHLQTYTGEKPHPCSECGRLYTHKRHICEVCDEAFSFLVQLRRHQVTHVGDAGEKPCHKCRICGKLFVTTGHLKTHQRMIHAEKRPDQCTVCGKSVVQANDFQKH